MPQPSGKQKRTYTPLEVYHLAQGFHLAGKRCYLRNEVEPRKWRTLPLAGAVNLCFASELFVKAILAFRKNPKQGHNLYKLFTALPPADQTGAATMYKQLSPGSLTLESELERIKNHFMDVRYWYENTLRGVLTDSAERCSTALYAYCASVLGEQMLDDTFPSLNIPITPE